MKFFSKVLFLSFLGISTGNAAAGSLSGFIINPNLFYQSSSTDTGSSTTNWTATYIGMKVGYAMSSGLYFGGGYDSVSTTSTSTTTDTMLSADLGYFMGSWSFIGSYILSATDEQSTTSKNKGTGMGLAIGYAFMMGNWGFGPQLLYSAISYDKTESSGVEATLSPSTKETNIMPRFGLWFHF